MDIEGSEREVLEAHNVHDWLSICKVLVIELHDRMKKGTSSALFKALLHYDVEMHQAGENMICVIKNHNEPIEEVIDRKRQNSI